MVNCPGGDVSIVDNQQMKSSHTLSLGVIMTHIAMTRGNVFCTFKTHYLSRNAQKFAYPTNTITQRIYIITYGRNTLLDFDTADTVLFDTKYLLLTNNVTWRIYIILYVESMQLIEKHSKFCTTNGHNFSKNFAYLMNTTTQRIYIIIYIWTLKYANFRRMVNLLHIQCPQFF